MNQANDRFSFLPPDLAAKAEAARRDGSYLRSRPSAYHLMEFSLPVSFSMAQKEKFMCHVVMVVEDFGASVFFFGVDKITAIWQADNDGISYNVDDISRRIAAIDGNISVSIRCVTGAFRLVGHHNKQIVFLTDDK